MERLTKPTARKTGTKYVSAIGSGYGAWPRIIQRLAAYENTGLEPEEINPRWIPVTEGLPTAWQIASDDEHAGEPLEFIVFIDGAKIPTTLYFNGTWFIDGCGEPYPVTHWKPMPAPPEED